MWGCHNSRRDEPSIGILTIQRGGTEQPRERNKVAGSVTSRNAVAGIKECFFERCNMGKALKMNVTGRQRERGEKAIPDQSRSMY